MTARPPTPGGPPNGSQHAARIISQSAPGVIARFVPRQQLCAHRAVCQHTLLHQQPDRPQPTSGRQQLCALRHSCTKIFFSMWDKMPAKLMPVLTLYTLTPGTCGPYAVPNWETLHTTSSNPTQVDTRPIYRLCTTMGCGESLLQELHIYRTDWLCWVILLATKSSL